MDEGRTSADEASFDPRTWIGREANKTVESRDATLPGASMQDRQWDGAAAKSATSSRSWLLAGGSGAAILIGGALIAYSSRPGSAIPSPRSSASQASAVETAAAVLPSRRTLVVGASADIAPALVAAGIPAADAARAADRAATALGAAPGEVRLVLDLRESGATATLLALEATRGDGAGIALTRAGDGTIAAQPIAAKLTTRVNVVRGEMDGDSFYTSAVAAGVTDSLISEFANAFSFDFNFATDVKAGDIFEAAFEQAYNPSGQTVGMPKLVYVALTTAAKSRALYRFTPAGGEPAWFDGNGHSTVRALMLTPVDGARISSKFGPRFHPVLHFLKMHKGTDFAAPTGTPIYASGDATVVWAAMKGANGNLTILQHDNGWQTYYLHQSMFMPGIVPGARVRQGQKIGEIGTTGRSTGPHLHYEVHIDGQPVDPMGIPTGGAKPLDGAARTAFDRERDRIDRARAATG